MSFYENTECPVCKKKFENGDDIVTCPDCGTPHHRECYKLVGHCVNSGLHDSDFRFVREHNQTDSPKPSDENDNYYIPQTDFNIRNESTSFPNQDVSEKTISDIKAIIASNSEYDRDTDTIDGESVSDVAATVVTNTKRFVNVFKKFDKTNKKTNWNWCAFIFGPLYLIFRKMYKFSIAFLCLDLSVLFGGYACFYKFAPKYMAEAQILFESVYSSANTVVQKVDISPVINAQDADIASMISYIMLGAFIVLRIIQGLFADNYYKKTVMSIIKRVSDDLNEGGAFIQSPIFMSSEMNFDKEQLKKIYLSKKGGVSYFLPLALIFLIEIIFLYNN